MSERRISINLSGSDSSSSNNNNNDERRDGGGHPMLTARRLSINLSQVATHDIHNTSAFPDNACNDANGAAPATTEHSARRRSFNLSLNLGSHNSNDNDSMVEDATEYMAMNIYDPSFEENVLQHLITVDGSTTVAALSHKSKVMLVFFKDLEDDYCMQMLSDLQRCATLVAQLSTRIVLCYHDKVQLEETASKFEGLSNPTSRSSGFLLVHDPQYHNYARFGITPLSLRTLTPRFISNMIKAVEDRLRSDEIDVNILGSVFIIEKGVVLCQHIASNRSEKIDFMRVLIDPGMGESGHGSLPGSEEDIIDEMHQQLHLQQQQQLQQQQDANNNNNNNGEMSLPELQLKTRKSAVEKIQRLISKSKTRRKATMNNNNNNNNKPATAMATPTTDPADTLTISSTPSACGSTTPRGDNMSTSTSTPRSTSSANSDDQDSQIIELQETLHDARKRRFFKLHASREFSMENILFWEAVELYRAKHRVLSSEERRAIAAAIIDRYFTKDSPWELNTESRLVHEVNEKLENSMLQYHREEQQQVHLKEPGPMVGTSAQPILLSTTYEKRQLKIPSLLPSRKGSVMKLTTYSSSSSSTSSENNSNSNSSNSNNNNNSSSGIINSNNFPPEDLFDSIRKDIEYGPLLDTYMRFRKTELFREMLFAVAEKSGRVRSAGGRAMSLGQTPRSLRSSSSSSNNSSSSSRKSMSSLFGHGGYSATTKRHSQG